MPGNSPAATRAHFGSTLSVWRQTRNMKVLHVLDHSLPIHSGYSFRTAAILAAQKDMDISVTALTGPKHMRDAPQGDTDGELGYERIGYQIKALSRVPIIGQAEVIRSLYNRIKGMLRETRFDIIHAHSPALNGIAAVRAAKEFSVPVVYEMRASWEDAAVDHGTTRIGGLRYRAARALESMVFRNVHSITTICNGLRQEIAMRGIDKDLITVIPNAVDTDRFYAAPEDERQSLRQAFDVDGKFVVAFCGSFYSYEGIDMLLAALRDLKDTMPETFALIAGGGEEENNLLSLAREYEISDMVRFLGRVTQEKVVQIYNLADVCAYPRRRMKLTDMVTPLKPLEAMSTRAIVLASDVGGHKELIRDGETGFLFEADSVESLTSKLRFVSGLKDLSEVRAAARSFVCSERTWQKSVAKYPDVYRQAIANLSRA